VEFLVEGVSGNLQRGRVVSAPTRQCFPEPAAKGPQAEALINQIKADEIEAGAITKMLEMAKDPNANSEQNDQELSDASAALESEANELKAEQNAAAIAAEARRVELARWKLQRDSAARTRDSLRV
jgi:FtsZ-binding cell division protein ZapB